MQMHILRCRARSAARLSYGRRAVCSSVLRLVAARPSCESMGTTWSQLGSSLPIAPLEDPPLRLPQSVERAAAFPSLESLAQCRSHQVGRSISSCVHLSNPATGSASLDASFTREPVLVRDSRHRLQYPDWDSHRNRYLVNSSHALNVAGMQSWLQRRRPKHWRSSLGAACIVITVRDPAARLQSAFRDSYMMSERLAMSLHTTRRNRTKATASLLVERLRQGLRGGMPTNAPARLYAASVSRPDWHGRLGNYPGPTNGSLFLVSQLWYLQGINCSRSELHIVCTERFDEDWRRFLGAFGAAPTGEYHKHKRQGAKPRTRAARAERNSFLNESDKAFVRNILYPWDTALHRWACGMKPV